jgi:RTX calcium-binding nonapeptide repeat (4 copies)
MATTFHSSSTLRKRCLTLLLVVIGLLLVPAAAHATTITVDSTADSLSGCTLRNAITAANTNSAQGTCPAGQASPTADTIDFAVSSGSTITLASALPAINQDLAIAGSGASQLTVSGADAVRVFDVNPGTTASISDLTVTHGFCNNTCVNGASGGGIQNRGTLTLDGVVVDHSTASLTNGGIPGGGGIYNQGTLTLTRSTVTSNTASSTGGTGQNSPRGGGILSFGGTSTVTIDRSTVSGNSVTANAGPGGTTNADGGGIENFGTLTVERSTFSGNTVSAAGSTSNQAVGGAIANANSASINATIDRSTISGNTASAGAPVSTEQGGGISAPLSPPGVVSVTSSTLTGNSAASDANARTTTQVTFKNTIVSNPQGGGANCGGGATSQGYNLEDTNSCGFNQPTDLPGTANTGLDPNLANNGGPTQTHALLPGSPAIDQGLASAGETIDQRGLTRPSDFGEFANATGGDGSDIGAFELQDTTPPDTIIDSGPSGTTHDPTPAFTFHSTEGGSTLECKLDGGAFSACSSPHTLAHLADGSHTFQVRATDAAHNTDPSPASRTFTVKTAAISRSGSLLVVTAAAGAKDNFKVTKPSASTIQITDLPSGSYTGSGVHTVAGSGCTRSGDYTANCSASGIAKVQISSGDGTDRVVNTTSLASLLIGGPANDILTGGSGNDTLNGAPGADTLRGMNGNDVLLAHDLASDTLINCDGGTKPGTADKADLDLLPKDPNAIVLGCETKTRH